MAKDKQYTSLQRMTPEIAASYPLAPLADLTPIYRNVTTGFLKTKKFIHFSTIFVSFFCINASAIFASFSDKLSIPFLFRLLISF